MSLILHYLYLRFWIGNHHVSGHAIEMTDRVNIDRVSRICDVNAFWIQFRPSEKDSDIDFDIDFDIGLL